LDALLVLQRVPHVAAGDRSVARANGDLRHTRIPARHRRSGVEVGDRRESATLGHERAGDSIIWCGQVWPHAAGPRLVDERGGLRKGASAEVSLRLEQIDLG